ncbi:hypothetical protein KDN24_24165 [Bacillus sp. Bva_UNVM-123]|uniref:hypothetical protein n=1 Tax=Bacillus sp. Bva_UNVM-123 TaxID=2829798 RepID=UPI00391F8CFC
MIIHLEELAKQQELEVIVKYTQMNDTVHQLITTIKSHDKRINGSYEDKQFRIKAFDIYYIESVDKKTFIYCEDSAFINREIEKNAHKRNGNSERGLPV